MHFTDDLKANFRSWEIDHVEHGEVLTNIIISRHPEANPNQVREWCYDWVGASVDEEV